MLNGEVKSFRKKPVVIQAVQWTFNGPMIPEFEGSWPAIKAFAGNAVRKDPADPIRILVTTAEGEVGASLNDWIIRGVQGEFYPIKPDIFAATYDPEPAPSASPSGPAGEPTLQEWVIFEAKGFRTLAGRLSETERAGAKLLQIEVPLGPPPTDGTSEKFLVQYYSPSSLHALTPVPEAVAREKARFYRPTNAVALLSSGASSSPPELELDEEGFLEQAAPTASAEKDPPLRAVKLPDEF
jgi:hypothetical protein